MPYLIKADVELQAIVPLKSLKKVSEQGLREVAIKQDAEFGFERHYKDKIDKSIDINFGFGKLTVRAKDLKEALKRAKEIFLD